MGGVEPLEIDYKAIGRRIAKERHGKHLKQEQLAEMSELSTVHIAHIEGGTTKLGLPALVRISNSLEVSPDILLSGVCYNCKEVLKDDLSKIINNCTSEQIRLIIRIAELIKNNKQE